MSTKGIIKKAKELYQQKLFDACLDELQPILSEGQGNNVNCLLLASACYDNLGKEDKAIDTIYKILCLDKGNHSAWRGLSQFCMKCPDRFYLVAVHCFSFLIPYYKCEGKSKECLESLKNFLTILVRYRLELPPGLPSLSEYCSLVLASDNANPFALEANIRLLVESAIFSSSENVTISNSFTVGFAGLNSEQTDLVLLGTYMERLRISLDKGSDTVHFTLALAQSFIETCRAMKDKRFVDLRQSLLRLQSLSLRGLKVGDRWQQQGFLDVHISALAAIITYLLNDFARCDFILQDLMDFCRSSYVQVAKDISQFTNFVNVPPSTLTDFLIPRLLYTPVRCFGNSLLQGQTPLHRVFDWAGCLLLSNAANSNFSHLLDKALKLYSSECLSTGKSLIWPLPSTILFTECCLLVNDTTTLHNFVDISSLSSPVNTDYGFSLEVTLRSKLIKYWFSLRNDNSVQQILLHKLLRLKEFLGNTDFSSHNHNLAGWLLLQIPSAPVDVILDHFNRGIKSDKTYFVNYLNIGHAFLLRQQDYVRALQAYQRSWQLVPGHPQIAYPLASTLCKVGKIKQAYEVYRITDHRLFTPTMCLNFGLITLRLKKLTECVPALQRAVRAQPMNPVVWEVLAESYMARRSFGIALQSLEKSIQLAPDRPMPHILYAQVCTAISDYPNALASYERALELLHHHKHRSLFLLAKKGLIEIHTTLAAQDLQKGMRTTAIGHIETVLLHGSSVLQAMSPNVLSWLWYYIGYALSFLLAFHYPDLKVRVPRVLACILKKPPASPADEAWCLLGITSCADLSTIMFSLFLKSCGGTGLTLEALLAWICLGLLELSRFHYALTEDEKGAARPLFGRFERFTKDSQHFLEKSKVCFLKSLVLSKQLLPSNNQITALAWFGMGSVLAFGRDVAAKQSTYCFAKAFSLCDQLSIAGVALASKLLEINRMEDTRRVLDLCHRKGSEYHGYWVVMAQLASVMAPDAGIGAKYGGLNELQCLLQAADYGFNLDTVWRLLPKVFRSLKRLITTELSYHEEEHLKLSRLLSAEYLNRCLTYYPNDYRQWHDRGLLLYLCGLPHPAHYCFRRAYDLLPNLAPNAFERLTVKAHFFLSSCQRGKVPKSLCEEFNNLSDAQSTSCGVHIATATAHIYKGDLQAARHELVEAYRVARIGSSCDGLICLTLASLHTGLFPEVEDEVLRQGLSVSPMNPLRRLVVAQALHAKPTPLTLNHLNAFLANPSYGYEYFVSQLVESSNTEQVRHLLALSKTWAFLRPDLEPVWTLLAAAQRMFSHLEALNEKSKTTFHKGAVASLLNASTVCMPNPTSELLTQELVYFVRNAASSEGELLDSMRPLMVRSMLFFPHVQGGLEALKCLYKFEIEMTCEGCANAVKRVLSKLGNDILAVNTDVEKNVVTITSTLPESTILETLQKTSKPVKPLND